MPNVKPERAKGRLDLREVLNGPTPEGSSVLRELRPGHSEEWYTWMQVVNELFGVRC